MLATTMVAMMRAVTAVAMVCPLLLAPLVVMAMRAVALLAPIVTLLAVIAVPVLVALVISCRACLIQILVRVDHNQSRLARTCSHAWRIVFRRRCSYRAGRACRILLRKTTTNGSAD